MQNGMPRGELKDVILLCSYKDKNNVLHGIGVRKAADGPIRIILSPTSRSCYSKEHSTQLTIGIDISEEKIINVYPELCGVKTEISNIELFFEDTDDTKDAISDFLQHLCIPSTLTTYFGFCLIQVSGDTKRRPSFVFLSERGEYTALHTTTASIYAAASVYVNYIQPKLTTRSYWRANCFETLNFKPSIVQWAKEPADLTTLKNVVTSCVLTFNSLNSSIQHQECDEDGVYHDILLEIPCPYDTVF